VVTRDWNVGLTGITIRAFMPLSEDNFVCSLCSNMPDTCKLDQCKSYLSDRALCAIRESQLKSLELDGCGLQTLDKFARFLIPLQSTVLEQQQICLYTSNSNIPAIAMAIQQCPALLHFSLDLSSVDSVHWGCLLNAFQNHKMLLSLKLVDMWWKDTHGNYSACHHAQGKSQH